MPFRRHKFNSENGGNAALEVCADEFRGFPLLFDNPRLYRLNFDVFLIVKWRSKV